jgi:hypothetical protein
MEKTTEIKKTDSELVKEAMARVRPFIRITKVVCTRSVKGPRGDSYVGFSAAFDTIQDDAGGGADLITAQDGDVPGALSHGLSLRDARLAALMLGCQVDIAAHAAAVAGGNMESKQFEVAAKAIRSNYTTMMADLIRTNGGK